MADVDARIAVVVLRVRWNQADGTSPAVAIRGSIAQIVRPSVVDVEFETVGEPAGEDRLQAVVIVGGAAALIRDPTHVRQRNRRQKPRGRLWSYRCFVVILPLRVS